MAVSRFGHSRGGGSPLLHSSSMIRVREGDDERILSIEEFEHLARRGELSPFAEVCLPAVTGERFVPARDLPLFSSLYDPRRLLFQKHFHLGRLPIVTGLVSLACVGLFLLAKDMGDGAVTRDALIALGAKARARIVDEGELWRVLMANLLHRDLTHLAFNLFALLNIGTVLEGVYRRGDYVLLLVVGGISAMGFSTLASGPVTVGASGIIFACLGCAIVFGLRFSDLLPLRYRVYFGVVVVGYAAVMFYLGLQRATTDNWGHAGGLIAGLIMGALLEPRLMRLTAKPEAPRTALVPWLLSLALVVIVAAAGPLVPRFWFGYEPHRFDMFGVELWRPTTWQKGPNPLGFLAFGNSVDALTSIACARVGARHTADAAAKRFVDDELRSLARAGHIGDLQVGRDAADEIDGVPARLIPFSFVASDGPFEARAFVFVRGDNECAFVLAHRASASPTSRAILDEIRARIHFVETKAQRDAANAVLNRPHDPRAQLDLAFAHQSAGDVDRARAAFVKAAAETHGDPGWDVRVQLGRARFELDFGGDLDLARREAMAALAASPADADTAVLVVDILLRRGELDAARAALGPALKLNPDDTRLLERQRAVGAATAAP
jgi:membrane associated rhomboid family serine protease